MPLPAWLAAWLEEHTDLNRIRVAVRGADVIADESLRNLHLLALAYRQSSASSASGTAAGAECGTSLAATRPGIAESEAAVLLGAADAGRLAGLTGRAARKALQEGRLPGEMVAGRWLVREADARAFAERRKRGPGCGLPEQG
jgi:hypothetical protein